MIEQPWEKDNGAIDDPDGVRVPGPEDDPMTAPRDEPVPDDGGSLDVPYPADCLARLARQSLAGQGRKVRGGDPVLLADADPAESTFANVAAGRLDVNAQTFGNLLY